MPEPLIGIVMTIFLLSLAGFPFTGGFIGKVFILQSAVSRGMVALAVILVLTSLVSYWYYLRMAWYMWFREPTGLPAEDAEPIAMNGGLKAALVISAVLVVLLGVLPNSLLNAAEKSAASLSVNAAELGLNR